MENCGSAQKGAIGYHRNLRGKDMESNKNDFTRGNILKKMLKFMVPVLGALILQAMYGAVDILVVGWFGTTAGISGVSTGSNIVNLVVFTVTGLSMGITVLIGRYIGEKEDQKAGKVIGGAVWFFAVLSVILAAVLLIFARPLAILMQAPEEALDLTVIYERICGGGIFFIVAYNVISSIFRGMGNSRLPLIFVAIACGVNIVGDLFFVAVLDMNVAGAALATVLAQAVSVVMSLAIIRRQKLPFTMTLKDIGINPEIWKFVKVGAPIAFQEILTQLSFLALCAFINRLGLEASSGYGVANKIVSFIMLLPSALMQTMSAFVAQNVGAGREDRARKALFTESSVYRHRDRLRDRYLYRRLCISQRRSDGLYLYRRSCSNPASGPVSEGLCSGGRSDRCFFQLYRIFQWS